MDNMSMPKEKNEYTFKIPHPCHTCDNNISRDDSICQICTAAPAYNDHINGVEHSLYSWETGPEILEKNNNAPAKYGSLNKKPKKRADGKKILKRLGYESELDLINALYYERHMTFMEMAAFIRYKTNGPCTNSYIKGIFRRTGKTCRGINNYRDEGGMLVKNIPRAADG